jgi:hypothetical protein
MHIAQKNEAAPQRSPGRSFVGAWLLLAAWMLVVWLALFNAPRHSGPAATGPTNNVASLNSQPVSAVGRKPRIVLRGVSTEPAPTAEQIVAGKVRQFGRNRRELVRAVARRSEKVVPTEVEKFFDAIEAGQWEEIKAQWDVLATHSGQYDYSTNHWEQLNPFWPAVLDAYGVAEQAHLWPAQQLLDYGNAILGSLKPGMVYVGGTDNGRWIPELLNETAEGEQHMIVTQNALADSRYLDFVNTLYSDHMATLTSEDSQGAFQAYVAEAQKRFEHDQQFPDEPKQVRPGEDLKMVDGKLQVSGQVAVMSINELLLQTLMQKNPELSFAIQESFPLKGTYPNAVPLGPLMQLNATDPITADQAGQSVQYWQTAAQQALADPATANSEPALRSYSHDANSAANLLAAHNFTSEAEQAYGVAAQLYPGNPEPVNGLADLLVKNGQQDQARQLLQDFGRRYPDQQKFLERSPTWILLIGNH